MPRKFEDLAEYREYLRAAEEAEAEFFETHGMTPQEARDIAQELRADARRDEDEI